MGYINGIDREQSLLLPESLEEYLPLEHSARFIDAFVEGLDLGRCGFGRTRPKETGRPPYAPKDLLKLYLWGYLNQVRSSRKLERECGRNLEVLWLLRKLAPDFKTIADFRRENAKAFKRVFREFNLLCGELKLFGKELVAIDGTKLKADNNPARNFTPEKLRAQLGRIDQRLAQYLSEMEQSDRLEGQQEELGAEAGRNGSREAMGQKLALLRERQALYQQALEEVEQSGEKEISLTDPDSRRMHKVGVGYNGQIAVDQENHLIVGVEVVQAKTDHGQLSGMAVAAQETLGGEKLVVVADGGYFDLEDIVACEAAVEGVEIHLPRPHKGSAEAGGRFGKEAFTYDARQDNYQCPGGAILVQETTFLKRGQPYTAYANVGACRQCPIKKQCTMGDYRRVSRWEKEDRLEALYERVKRRPEIMTRRKAVVEHVFGSIKHWGGQSFFLLRGLEKVGAEWSLSALSYNLRRVLNLLGVEALLEHLKKRTVTA